MCKECVAGGSHDQMESMRDKFSQCRWVAKVRYSHLQPGYAWALHSHHRHRHRLWDFCFWAFLANWGGSWIWRDIVNSAEDPSETYNGLRRQCGRTLRFGVLMAHMTLSPLLRLVELAGSGSSKILSQSNNCICMCMLISSSSLIKRVPTETEVRNDW